MSTHPNSPQVPTHHSFDTNNGWQVWDSTSLHPASSTPCSPRLNTRPRSSSAQASHSPNPPRAWVDSTSTEPPHPRSFISNSGVSPSSVPRHGSGSAYSPGHKQQHPQLEAPLSFSAAPDSDILRSTPFPRNYDPSFFTEDQQPYNVLSSNRQVIPQAIPPSAPAPEYHIPYYRPTNELPYPMATEASYYPSHILSPTYPTNLYPSIPVPRSSTEIPPHCLFEYSPTHGMPFIFPTPPFLISAQGQPPQISPTTSHFEQSREPQKHTSPRYAHSPRSHSESYTLGFRQFRMRSDTIPPTTLYPGQSESSADRFTGREAPPRTRTNPPKNSLLEQFRNNRDRNWELADIHGSMVDFASDQYGSRFIQDQMQIASSQKIQYLFDELLPSKVLPLMMDVFGNYVVQKMFEYGTETQRSTLVQIMTGHALELTLHMYGCRVVQKAIETITPHEQSLFVSELSPGILQCVKDANGNHVVQRLVQSVPSERLTFLNLFSENIEDLASHPYGCRVLQRCLEHLPPSHSRPLVISLATFTSLLVQNQFGNYVMQYVLEHGRPEDRAGVIEAMRPSFVALSRHKYASNVCEKALTCGNIEERRSLIRSLLGTGDEERAIALLMRDQYANYVLQKALLVAEGTQKARLYPVVRVVANAMRQPSAGYSKNLLAIEKLLDKYPPTSTTLVT